jgi:hypothetical protein
VILQGLVFEMHPTAERLTEAFNTIEPYIERVYGIPVVITDVPAPFTGDLDGSRILVDFHEDVESALFIVAHLFGHTVQWCTCPLAREIGMAARVDPSPENLERVRRYEVDACRYSLQLFHDAGIRDLDQWMSDFAACDYAYLENFYRTGQKSEFRSFWRDNQPLLTPLPIPPFVPQRWTTRWEGIVV